MLIASLHYELRNIPIHAQGYENDVAVLVIDQDLGTVHRNMGVKERLRGRLSSHTQFANNCRRIPVSVFPFFLVFQNIFVSLSWGKLPAISILRWPRSFAALCFWSLKVVIVRSHYLGTTFRQDLYFEISAQINKNHSWAVLCINVVFQYKGERCFQFKGGFLWNHYGRDGWSEWQAVLWPYCARACDEKE